MTGVALSAHPGVPSRGRQPETCCRRKHGQGGRMRCWGGGQGMQLRRLEKARKPVPLECPQETDPADMWVQPVRPLWGVCPADCRRALFVVARWGPALCPHAERLPRAPSLMDGLPDMHLLHPQPASHS